MGEGEGEEGGGGELLAELGDAGVVEADGEGGGAHVDGAAGLAEEGPDALVATAGGEGGAGEEDEAGGLAQGVGGAGGDGALLDDGGAVEVGRARAAELEVGRAALDDAAHAGERAEEASAGVGGDEGHGAAAELDAGEGVAGEVADGLVGVVEAEGRADGGAGAVEGDGAGVEEGVVDRAGEGGEGDVDAVVDDELAGEAALLGGEVEGAEGAGGVDLELLAGAVVDGGAADDADGAGAEKGGLEGGGVVLVDAQLARGGVDARGAEALGVDDEAAAADLGLGEGALLEDEGELGGVGGGVEDEAAGEEVVDGVDGGAAGDLDAVGERGAGAGGDVAHRDLGGGKAEGEGEVGLELGGGADLDGVGQALDAVGVGDAELEGAEAGQAVEGELIDAGLGVDDVGGGELEGAEDGAAVIAVALGVLADDKGVAAEEDGGADAGAGDDELAAVGDVGRAAHGLGDGFAARAVGEVGLEVADGLVVGEDKGGAGERLLEGGDGVVLVELGGDEGEGGGAGLGGVGGLEAGLLGAVAVGVDRLEEVAVMGAAAGKLALGAEVGAVAVAQVHHAGEVDARGGGEGAAGGGVEDEGAAGDGDIAGEARLVEDGEGARARLHDGTRPGEDADGALEALVDMEEGAVLRGGADDELGLELVVVDAGLEVAQVLDAKRVALGDRVGGAGGDEKGRVGELEDGGAVEDDAGDAGHAARGELALGLDEGEGAGLERLVEVELGAVERGVVGDLGDGAGSGTEDAEVGEVGGAEVVPDVEEAGEADGALVDGEGALEAVESASVAAVFEQGELGVIDGGLEGGGAPVGENEVGEAGEGVVVAAGVVGVLPPEGALALGAVEVGPGVDLENAAAVLDDVASGGQAGEGVDLEERAVDDAHVAEGGVAELEEGRADGGRKLADDRQGLAGGDGDDAAAGGIEDRVGDGGEGAAAADGGDGLNLVEHGDRLDIGAGDERGQHAGGGDQRGLGQSHESGIRGKNLSVFSGKGVSTGYPPSTEGEKPC